MTAPFRPSESEEWGHCAGYPRDWPSDETDETREGTAAHWVFEQSLRHPDEAIPGAFEGRPAPNGVIVTPLMERTVLETAARVCQGIPHFDGMQVSVECGLEMPEIDSECRGTADVVGVHYAQRRLIVADYKHGRVPVQSWTQWLCYAEGARHRLQINGHADADWTLELYKFQPRGLDYSKRVDSWTMPLSDLRAHVNLLNGAAQRARRADDGEGVFTAGSWCLKCPRRVTCPARRGADHRLLAAEVAITSARDMSGPELSDEYDALRELLRGLKDRTDALGDELRARIQAGDLTGHAIRQTPGRRQYTVEPEAARLAFQMATGWDIARPSVRTPAQVRDEAPAAIRPQVDALLARLTDTAGGNTKLIRREESVTSKAIQEKKT